MPRAVRFPIGFRDVLLVLVVATGATAAGAIAAESMLPEIETPVAYAAPVTTGPENLAATVLRPSPVPCRCSVPARLDSAASPGRHRRDNPPPAMLRALGTRAEAGSFAAWQRAETDPRRILVRLAVLSRNAPPKHGADPGSAAGSIQIR